MQVAVGVFVLVLGWAWGALWVAVDARLVPALELLAGSDVGAVYADQVRTLRLVVEVGPLPAGAAGRYQPARRTVTVSEALLAEDVRVVAALLAHELQHASDADLVAVGLLAADCLALEVRGYQAQAAVGRALYPEELPSGTVAEQQLAGVVAAWETGGADLLRERIAADVLYGGCHGEAARAEGPRGGLARSAT
jgi:hypothetical protein